MKNPLITIIIPCRNEAEHIVECLESVLKQEALPGELEVIVADGCSEDGTREILNQVALKDSRVVVIENPEKIVSTGLNKAIKKARGEIIIRMDAHTRYASNYIKNCYEVLSLTQADCVGGPWVAKGTSYASQAIASAFQSPFVVGGARGHDVTYEGKVDTVYLGCWKSQVFGKVGLFDEELVRNQDDELNLRITRKGGKVWQSPQIRSYYNPRKSFTALFRQYYQYGYWKVRVIQKHKIPASWRHLVPAAFLLTLCGLGIMGLFSKASFWIWLMILAAYFLFNVVASLDSAIRGGYRLLPILPAIISCYHIGYGSGFLLGIWDFIIWGRGHRTSSRRC